MTITMTGIFIDGLVISGGTSLAIGAGVVLGIVAVSGGVAYVLIKKAEQENKKKTY